MLHQAASWGRNDVCAKLMDFFGADPSVTTADRMTAADVARMTGHGELASFLKAA